MSNSLVGRRPSTRTIFALVLAASLLYVFTTIDRGWVPHDEGTLAEPAARVLRGELPHRDFDDMYTGGLTFLHAAVFEVGGANLLVLRLTLFAAFALWVPAVFFLGLRLSGPVGAAIATLLAVAWSVPNYPAAMPSWYNLFLATWGVVLLVRHEDTGRHRWLFAAGVVGGLSILVKVVGLYFVAAGLLYLVYRSQSERPTGGAAATGAPSATRPSVGPALFVTAGLVLFVVVVATLVARRPTPEALFHFVLPSLCVAGSLVWTEWTRWPTARDLGRLLRATLLFAAGAALPVALFVVAYAAAAGVGALYRGVLLLPAARFTQAWRNPDALATAVAGVPVVALGAAAVLVRGRAARWVAAAAALLGTALLVFGSHTPVYRAVWLGIRPLFVVAVIGGLLVVHRRGRDVDASRARLLFLLVALLAVHTLVQFPTSAPIYAFYVAPLLALVALGIFALTETRGAIPLVLAGFHMLFAALWLNTGYVYQMGDYYAAHPPTEPLRLERGGIRVVPQEKSEVEQMVAYVDELARGDYILALPDAPEVYFLTGKRNPTRTLFDFFDEPEGRVTRILRVLDAHDVRVVVLNRDPAGFSGPPPQALLDSLRVRYPQATQVGRFIVRWSR